MSLTIEREIRKEKLKVNQIHSIEYVARGLPAGELKVKPNEIFSQSNFNNEGDCMNSCHVQESINISTLTAEEVLLPDFIRSSIFDNIPYDNVESWELEVPGGALQC